jgi:hypothetical protein
MIDKIVDVREVLQAAFVIMIYIASTTSHQIGLVVCLMLPEQFVSYPAAITNTRNRAAKFRPMLSTHGF